LVFKKPKTKIFNEFRTPLLWFVDRNKLHMDFLAQVIRVIRRQMRHRHLTPPVSSSSSNAFRLTSICTLSPSAAAGLQNPGLFQKKPSVVGFIWVFGFLCAKAATALVRLSHRNSVHLSICHTGGSVKNGAS